MYAASRSLSLPLFASTTWTDKDWQLAPAPPLLSCSATTLSVLTPHLSPYISVWSEDRRESCGGIMYCELLIMLKSLLGSHSRSSGAIKPGAGKIHGCLMETQVSEPLYLQVVLLPWLSASCACLPCLPAPQPPWRRPGICSTL